VHYFEKQGLPGVAILSDAFEPQAKYQAKSLGMADIAKVFVKHPISDQSTAQLNSKADAVFEDIVRFLNSVPPPQAPLDSDQEDIAECAT